MNSKEIVVILYFLALGFMPKVNSETSFTLIINKDTFGIMSTFLTYEGKITSNKKKMMQGACLWGLHGGSPIWEIENDSLFLKNIRVRVGFENEQDSFADLSKRYKKNYVNGRVFAKEINTEIIAWRINEFETDTAIFYNETISFVTIIHGKLVKYIEFTGTTQWAAGWRDAYHYKELVVQKTDWKTQPQMPLDGGTKVVVSITVDDKGKLTKTEITEGGDKRWNKEVLNIINRLSMWESNHISYADYDKPKVRYKKEKVILIVKKPH